MHRVSHAGGVINNTKYQVPKNEWIQTTKDALDALDVSLARAELRLSNIATDVDESVRSRAAAARAKLDDWRSKLKDAHATAADAWETMGSEVATAWEGSRAALEIAIQDIEHDLEGDSPDTIRPEDGDTVFVHYRGRLEDGTEFQSTRGREPIEFVLGKNHVVPGFERAVAGMHLGEKKSVLIPVDDAFGPRNESLVFDVDRDAFTEEEVPNLGDRATLQREDGSPLLVTVRKIENDTVEVDANHPLAGHDLHMDLKVVGIT